MLIRRRGMPLVRAAATTAVVAATAGAVRHHQEEKYSRQAAEAEARYAEEAAAAAQPPYQPVPEPVAAAPAPPAGLDMAQLKQLGELHESGVLTDEEFAAAKAKLINAI